MFASGYLIYLLLIIGMIASVRAKKLTILAALAGGIVGLLVFKGAGYGGIIMLTLFFICGSGATSWQRQKKQLMNRAEKHTGGRTAGQVLANGGVAAIMGALAWLYPHQIVLFILMMAGSLAAATADTLSSELGTVYGRRFYNMITFKKDERGLDGVISLEGTLIGIAGTALIALVYIAEYGFGIDFFYIVLAGFTGNLVDSVLGATLERRHLVGNNTVNFINTLTGALVCLLLTKLTV